MAEQETPGKARDVQESGKPLRRQETPEVAGCGAPKPELSLDPKEGGRKVREPRRRPQGLSRYSLAEGHGQGRPVDLERAYGPRGVKNM